MAKSIAILHAGRPHSVAIRAYNSAEQGDLLPLLLLTVIIMYSQFGHLATNSQLCCSILQSHDCHL